MRSAVLLLFSLGAVGQEAPKPAKPKKPKQTREGVSLEFDQYPTLRAGEWLRMDARVRIQMDLRHYDPDVNAEDGTFEVRRARVSLEGWAFRDLEYEVDVAVDEGRLRDAFVNYRRFRDFQLRVGKFKIPLGLDQLTSPTRLDFVYRSRIGAELAPARDVGAMLHGRFLNRGLSYQTGWFYGSGENTREDVEVNTRERTLAARVTGTPLRILPVPDWLKTMELGVASTLGKARAGRFSSRIRTLSSFTTVERFFVQGPRYRLGTELNWLTGPFSVRGEFMHMRVSREKQSLFETDLPDLLARGWYLSGSWLLTGERKEERTEPARPLFRGGFGAVELAARYEQMRFASTATSGMPQRNPRAANVYRNSDRVWTWGVNWYLNAWGRIQVNYIHETIEDPPRAPLEGLTRFRAFVTRLQFVL